MSHAVLQRVRVVTPRNSRKETVPVCYRTTASFLRTSFLVQLERVSELDASCSATRTDGAAAAPLDSHVRRS